MENSITELLTDIRRRYGARLEQVRQEYKNKGISENTGNFKELVEGEVQSEIVDEMHFGAEGALVPHDIYKYSSDRNFLRALIRISPAYICCASKEVLEDVNFLKSIAEMKPMSIVHLYGNSNIDKDTFLKLVKCEPMILQNFCAYGDYGLVSEEMIDAALYQVDSEEKKSYKQLILGYEVAKYCMDLDEIGEFTDERIDYLAEYALPYSLYEIIKTDDAHKKITELLKKYPQAIKSLDELDVKPYEDNMDKYYENIQEAVDANPDVERFYLMDDEEFKKYMDGFIAEKRKSLGQEQDDGEERKATIDRINRKRSLLDFLRGKNQQNSHGQFPNNGENR